METTRETRGAPPPLPGSSRSTRQAGNPSTRFSPPGCSTLISILVFGAILMLPGWIWFFWRIEPGPNQLAVLIRKTGTDLPSGQILAQVPGQKGIQLQVLPSGRYFRNPYTWGSRIVPITDIPAGRMGVLTRLYGRELPAGRILAEPEAPGTVPSKGIVAEVLRPGRHPINPYAYALREFDAISIRPGFVGVTTSLIGSDFLTDPAATNRNGFLVGAGAKGVVPTVLDPGTYYINPYVYDIVEVNLQSQRFQMSGDDAISFLTQDGFQVAVEGTIEYAIDREKAALLTHRVGDLEDIERKVIMPRARGFSRIEGSKKKATDYIVGETRQAFQDRLETDLRERCKDWGVLVKSVLIRNITPPDAIASIIRESEVAVQNARMYEQQIEQARSKAELTRQEMLALQNKARVEAETDLIRATITARQEQSVSLTNAVRELQVAGLENEAATFQARAIELEAEAQRDVVRLENEARAAVVKRQVEAFGDGLGAARHTFYTRVAPNVKRVVTTDGPDGLGALLTPYLPPPVPPAAPKGGTP